MSGQVLVSGASSQLGAFLLPLLQAGGYRVLALSRRAPRSAVSVSDRVRWQDPGPALGEDYDRDSGPGAQSSFLVSCGPLELACRLVSRQEGLHRAVAFSSSSVLTKADSNDPAERRRMAEIEAAEIQLRDLCGERGISLLLLRPTLIYGCGLDSNVSLLARFGRRFGFIPVAGPAAGLRQPVHAEDLAALAVRAIGADHLPEGISAACGGDTLSYRAMAEKIAPACGPRVRAVSLPPGLLSAGVRAARLFPANRGIGPEMVRRQAVDMVFDDSALRKTLDYSPRPFEPRPSDFEIPEEAAALSIRSISGT